MYAQIPTRRRRLGRRLGQDASFENLPVGAVGLENSPLNSTWTGPAPVVPANQSSSSGGIPWTDIFNPLQLGYDLAGGGSGSGGGSGIGSTFAAVTGLGGGLLIGAAVVGVLGLLAILKK